MGRIEGKYPSVVLGGGLAGLSAAYAMGKAGTRTLLIEAEAETGGLCRTISTGPGGEYLYDIGGHRFITKHAEIDEFVRALLGQELITVNRQSKIFMRDRFFNYPLKPANAILGLGPLTIAQALMDYGYEKARALILGKRECVSLEDWVVASFGRTMFNLYFKEYSEKVWGLECSEISESWVARRIGGLSMWEAVKNALFKFSGRGIDTLADRFIYPSMGIGRIAGRLSEEIERHDGVLMTSTRAERIHHDGCRITSMSARNCEHTYSIEAESYISTIPLPYVARIMEPAPPESVLEAAARLGFRDLVTVAVMLDRPSVTDLHWVYIPEKKYQFGRLHEPKCWSAAMAPEGRTLVVVEFFCFQDDEVWGSSDERLGAITVSGLEELGFLSESDVIGTEVLRIPRAYPLFEVGYERHCKTIYDYLAGFENLHIAGRSGMFQYQNMDHAMASGWDAAREALRSINGN